MRAAHAEAARELAGSLRGPKPWVQCSIEEKIERCREQVKQVAHHVNYMNDALNRLASVRDELVEHRHDVTDGGRVMLPATGRNPKTLYGEAGCCCKAEVDPQTAYF